MQELRMDNACWDCPSMEERRGGPCADRIGGQTGITCILPARQNLEARVYETAIRKRGLSRTSGPYCIERLTDIEDFEFELLSSPEVRSLLSDISSLKGKDLILELEAPFSILAALMNPMDLYLCFEEEADLLTGILKKIAIASADYMKACIEAGSRVISLADPVGTMDLVGQEYYSRFCGPAALILMSRCQPFLQGTIVHICRKMSQSLIIAGQARREPWLPGERAARFMDILHAMAEDESIHYTGMTCIHNDRQDMGEFFRMIPCFSEFSDGLPGERQKMK